MNWDDIKLVVIPIAVFFWTIYWPVLRVNVMAIWAKKDGFWWKVRGSLISVFTSAGPCLLEVWKNYGGVIISLVIAIIKAKLFVPATVKGIKSKLNSL
jgi:hypothetical protein